MYLKLKWPKHISFLPKSFFSVFLITLNINIYILILLKLLPSFLVPLYHLFFPRTPPQIPNIFFSYLSKVQSPQKSQREPWVPFRNFCRHSCCSNDKYASKSKPSYWSLESFNYPLTTKFPKLPSISETIPNTSLGFLFHDSAFPCNG